MDGERDEGFRSRPVTEIVRAASFLVSCRVCGKLHKPECPLDLNPVCPACSGRYQAASLHMGGCHALKPVKIDQEVTRISPGNYALGSVDGGRFVARYVGRSDSDVKGRLQAWVGVGAAAAGYGRSAEAQLGARHRGSSPPGTLALRTPALPSLGSVADRRYTHFQFSYAACAQAAFEKECRNYHDLGGSYGLDNERHPEPPEGASWPCPMRDRHRPR